MDNRPAVISPNVWIAAVVLVAVGVGVVAMLRIDRSGAGGSGLSERFDYNIDQYEKIDPARIEYRQTQEFPTLFDEARAVAVGPDDGVYVAGDEAIHRFDPTGTRQASIALPGQPSCLAVGRAAHAFPGRVYVGVGRNVEVFDPEGNPVATWEIPGEKVQMTSVALARDDVFIADCANRIVLRYDASGTLVGRIGGYDKARRIPGFAIPSPFFDVAVAPDGLLWVVNPGALRLEAYSFEGNLELFWGDEGVGIDEFFGCCNPAHFTFLTDGRFVTAEKGLLRAKVYSPEGQFECVVAGPEQLDSPPGPNTESRFDQEHKAVDVAADGQDRVLILDLAGSKVRIYERKEPVSEETDRDNEPTEAAENPA
jgi:hypothetical protein